MARLPKGCRAFLYIYVSALASHIRCTASLYVPGRLVPDQYLRPSCGQSGTFPGNLLWSTPTARAWNPWKRPKRYRKGETVVYGVTSIRETYLFLPGQIPKQEHVSDYRGRGVKSRIWAPLPPLQMRVVFSRPVSGLAQM